MAVRTRFSSLIVALIAVALLGGGLVACSGAQGVPSSSPMPEGQNFEGVWYSQQFEHMYLRQDGDQVEGVYAYRNGGRLEGEVDGNVLVFDWVEPGDKEQARRTMSGRGYLQLTVDDEGPKLDGEWGYGDDVTGGGPWEAEFIREFDPETDPLTIDEIDEKGD